MSQALKTDLYQLTMMAGQYVKGLHKKIVTCEAFARRMPESRRFFVMSGTEEIRNFLLNLRFTKDDVEFLREVPMLKDVMSSSNFGKYLLDFRFTGDMWAMAEGEIAFAGEPLVRITAPLPQAQIAETFILSVLNNDIKVASKAARVVMASRGKPVLEFSTRRNHHEAAMNAARSAYLAGFASTSNVEAARRYNIPVTGTMAHMWVMIHENEEKAFQNFKDVFRHPTLLVDTYDTLKGVEIASKISGLNAIRLDSGDLALLARQAREILDSTKNTDVKIVVSSDLDEYKIDQMEKDGAPIDCYAVGTELVVSRDAPSLGIVYKVVYDETENRPLIKGSSGKQTLPGRKQVFLDRRNDYWTHLIAIENAVKETSDLTPLLDCNINGGKVCESVQVDLEISRKYCNTNIANLHPSLLGLEPAELSVPVIPDDSLINMFKQALEIGDKR